MTTTEAPVHPGDRIQEGDWFVTRGYYGYQLAAYRADKVTAKQVKTGGRSNRTFSRCQIAAVLCTEDATQALVAEAREIDQARTRKHSEANTEAAQQLAAAIARAEAR